MNQNFPVHFVESVGQETRRRHPFELENYIEVDIKGNQLWAGATFALKHPLEGTLTFAKYLIRTFKKHK